MGAVEGLDMFDEAEVKATFFTLGWVAKRNPALIRTVRGEGYMLDAHISAA